MKCTTELLLATQLGYEIRSTTVHEQMMEMWKSNFNVKTVSKSKVRALELSSSDCSYLVFIFASVLKMLVIPVLFLNSDTDGW